MKGTSRLIGAAIICAVVASALLYFFVIPAKATDITTCTHYKNIGLEETNGTARTFEPVRLTVTGITDCTKMWLTNSSNNITEAFSLVTDSGSSGCEIVFLPNISANNVANKSLYYDCSGSSPTFTGMTQPYWEGANTVAWSPTGSNSSYLYRVSKVIGIRNFVSDSLVINGNTVTAGTNQAVLQFQGDTGSDYNKGLTSIVVNISTPLFTRFYSPVMAADIPFEDKSFVESASLYMQQVGGRAYTPQCLGECHMVLEISNGKDADTGKTIAESFDSYAKNSKGAIVDGCFDRTTDVYVNATKERSVWKSDIVCSGEEKNGTKICSDEGSYVKETYYEMEWQPLTKQNRPSGTYFIDIRGERRSMEGCSAVDVVPKIYGVELKQFAWWNASWGYSKNITIAAVDALSAYQVPLNITKSANMRSDYGDLRFVGADGSTELSYWLEDYSATNAYVWVKVSVAAGESQDIVMYYGNPTATTTEDIQATMLDGDEFTGASLNATKWTKSWDAATCHFNTGGTQGLEIYDTSGVNAGCGVKTTATFTLPYKVITRVNATDLNAYGGSAYGFFSPEMQYATDYQYIYSDGMKIEESAKLPYTFSNNVFYYFQQNVSATDETVLIDKTTIIEGTANNADGKGIFLAMGCSVAKPNNKVSWLYYAVAKDVDNEPSVTIGPEQSNVVTAWLAWDTNTSNISTPYNGQKSTFAINWAGTNNVSTVYIEGNWSGNATNYSIIGGQYSPSNSVGWTNSGNNYDGQPPYPGNTSTYSNIITVGPTISAYTNYTIGYIPSSANLTVTSTSLNNGVCNIGDPRTAVECVNRTDSTWIYVDCLPENTTINQRVISLPTDCLNTVIRLKYSVETPSGASVINLYDEYLNSSGGSVYSYNSVLPIGHFYWKSFANDTTGKQNVSDTWTFSIDKPILQYSSNQSSTPPTYSTTNLSTFSIVWNGLSPSGLIEGNWSGVANYTMKNSNAALHKNYILGGTPTGLNTTGLLTDGIVNYTYVGGLHDYWYTPFNSTILLDLNETQSINSIVIWGVYDGSYLVVNPDSVTVYGSKDNSTWTNLGNLSTTFTTLNTYSMFGNYSASQYRYLFFVVDGTGSGNAVAFDEIFVYSNSYSDILPAGSFYWKSYATDSLNYQNVSDTWQFTINKANPTCVVFTSANTSYGNTVTATCGCGESEGITHMSRNGLFDDSENGVPTAIGAGLWNYVCNITTSQNYTTASDSKVVQVTPIASSCSILYSTPISGVYPLTTNLGCVCTNKENTAHLFRNASNADAENNTDITLPAGIWTYTCNVTASQNYTKGTVDTDVNISTVNSILHLYFNGTEGNMTVPINSTVVVTASSTNNATNITLYVNSMLITTGYPMPTDYLSVGSTPSETNMTIMQAGDSNHTTSTPVTFWIISIPAPPSPIDLKLSNNTGNYTDQNISAIYGTPIKPNYIYNLSAGGSPQIWTNDTLTTSTWTILGVGIHPYKANVTGSGTLWMANTTLDYYVTVYQVTPTCTLFTTGNTTYSHTITATCGCAESEGTVHMYRDAALADVENGAPMLLGAGTYNYTCNITASQNYTVGIDTTTIGIAKLNSSMDVNINNGTAHYNQNVTIVYGTNITVTATSTNLYKDKASVANPYSDILGVGLYAFEGNHSGNANYTANSTIVYLNILPATSSINLYLNGTANNMVFVTNITNVTTNTTATSIIGTPITLWVNNTNYTVGNSPLVNLTTFYNLSAGTSLNITASQDSTINYTAYSTTLLISVVAPAPPVINSGGGGTGSSYTGNICGDGYCSQYEDYTNCPTDCSHLINITPISQSYIIYSNYNLVDSLFIVSKAPVNVTFISVADTGVVDDSYKWFVVPNQTLVANSTTVPYNILVPNVTGVYKFNIIADAKGWKVIIPIDLTVSEPSITNTITGLFLIKTTLPNGFVVYPYLYGLVILASVATFLWVVWAFKWSRKKKTQP